MNPTDSVLVRRMTHADLEAVEAIDRASFPLPWPPGAFRYELEKKSFSHCWVAERDGEIAGVLVGWLAADEFQIATLATAPNNRRRGIARKLMETALQAAQAAGACVFTLEVRAGNSAAQSLYRAFGFRIVGTRPGGYSDGEDAVLMERDG